MRILLDANLDVRLAPLLSWHEVTHVSELGWEKYSDGDLLNVADSRFDCFVTADQNLPYQNPIQKLNLRIVVIAVGSLRLDRIRPYIPEILEALSETATGQLHWIRGTQSIAAPD